MLQGILDENLHHHRGNLDFRGVATGRNQLAVVEVTAQGRRLVGTIVVDKLKLLGEADAIAVAQFEILLEQHDEIGEVFARCLAR